jgi:hypothetical protein
MSVFDDAWSAFEQQAGPVLADQLSLEAPVGDPDHDPTSGTLAASMKWEDQAGVLTAGSSDPRGPIAAYVTRGTRPHSIDPVNGEFLTFYSAFLGRWVKTRHVDHPGTTANQFHIRAWEECGDEVRTMFREMVGEGVALAYLNPWRNQTLGSQE